MRKLFSSVAAIGLVAAAAPAMAQALLADVAIEGTIQGFEAATPGDVAPNGLPIIGVVNVMGATVKVPADAVIHSPTNDRLTWAQFTTVPFVGRTQPGFLGGTAIVTGDSQGGVIYAADLFSDMSENVVVGEAIGSVTVDDGSTRASVNRIPLVPLDDPRMPAGAPINGFGFEVNPAQITVGSLVSVEGYFAGGKLNYHTFEADGASLINPGTAEVSILRAQCRFRGGNRNEVEVRGGTKNPAGGQVTIQYSNPNATGGWTSVTPNVAPVVDTTVTPAQGLYRYTSSSLTFPATFRVCPAQVRAFFTASPSVVTPGFSPDSR
jgi:hypothetical protein